MSGTTAHNRTVVGRAVSDGLCALAAFAVAGVLQFHGHRAMASYLLVIGMAPPVWIVVFSKFGLYRRDPLTSWEEFRRVLSAVTVGAASVVLASVWLDGHQLRTTLALAWLVGLLLELAVRPLWRRRFSQAHHQLRLAYKTLIIGTNDEAGDLADRLAADDSGFLPLGYVASSAPRGPANGLQVLGGMDDLVHAIRHHRAECVFVASSGVSAADMARLVTVARRENVDVRISAKMPDVLPDRVTVELVGDVPSLSIRRVRLSPGKAFLKRSFDLIASSSLLLAASPVLLLVALAVRLTSRGPVLFQQERVTKGGGLFRIYKFRTMYHRAAHEGVPSIDSTRLYFKMRDDPRLTRVGRVLRRYSLDELPQLWNVVRGDISLVGPRPLWSAQVDMTSETIRSRHEVRAGLTGWWQVNGRSGVDADGALRMDLFYVENWSLTLDFYILLKTIPTVLRSNAF